ncbi:hypothetical protein [Pseudaminobacter soli (ex Zhang et al. 2022)]|uniref:hypothetical protein n=1 Tax=Pseudaminobacter soli (ex Zhang et al. 2022) TaxID=2831468 RepID=UPI001F281C19
MVPGVQTASEVMVARRPGVRLLKFYPAEAAGGSDVLEDFARVFPDVAFMPSGKITFELLPGYARLSNIASVGGTWMLAAGRSRRKFRSVCVGRCNGHGLPLAAFVTHV